MPHATGTRLAALLFLIISLIPPWIQGIITIPLWLGLWRIAHKKEKEKKELLQNVG